MAESSARPPSPLLPAFGIRDLNEPPSSLGVVHISARQYNSTIQSQPDASLSYVDLDDGEVITVGTGFELEQRLDEPISPSTYHARSPVPAWPAFTNAMEEKQSKMHIFDIRHTSGSLAVWRDHEAYSSKTLRSQDTSATSTSATSSGPSITEHRPTITGFQPTASFLSRPVEYNASPACETRSSETPQQVQASIQLERALNDVFSGLQSHLGPLADFLESTANQLRNMAEKTREADTTPVENILNGFKNIVTGVGELGIDFLATLDEELAKNRSSKVSEASPQQTSQLPPSLPISIPAESRTESKASSDTSSVAKKVCFAETSPLKVNPLRPGYISHPPKFGVPSMPVPLVPLSIPSRSQFGVPLTCAKPSPLTTFAQASRLESAKGSIIDAQPSDPDVLTRYPPLPSLRKAASVGGFQARPESLAGHQRGMDTTSALSRYPSIGQLEERTRLQSMNTRLQSMNITDKPLTYTCASGTRYKKAPNGFWKLAAESPRKTDIYKKPTVEDDEVEFIGERAIAVPTVAVPAIAVPVKPHVTKAVGVVPKTQDTHKQRSASWYSAPLPGAWPESKPEEWYAALPNSTATIAKPLAAVSPLPLTSTSGQESRDLSPWISSPVSETYTRAPTVLRKSQTVNGTNPAARLNGPFDPLAHIPVLQPRPQRSQPDLSAPKVTSSHAKHVDAGPSTSGPFPRRSQTVHHTDRYRPRDVAPYPYPKPSLWENYVRNNHSLNTLPAEPSSPWSFYPEASRLPGSSFGGPVFTATRPPVVSTIRPIQSMGGLRTEAAKNSQSLKYDPAPRALAPHPIPALDIFQPNRLPLAAVNAVPIPSPPAVPAPVPAFVPAVWSPPIPSISRTSSILSPCPPAVTHPRGRSGVSPPAPHASKSVDECVRQLKAMGFGSDPHELSRLIVYAGAAAGEIEAAIEMIEEDREAARELEVSSQTSQVGSFRDVERDFGTDENPWEDYAALTTTG